MMYGNRRRRAPLVVLALALSAIPLRPGPATAAPTGEFRVSGGGLACITGTAPESAAPPYRDCLRIGPIRIGDTLRDVAMRFGPAGKEVRQGDVTLRVWPVRLNVPAGTALPYWVIGFDADRRVVSIQLSGERRVDDYAFSSLRLGDPQSRVLRVLGEPSERQPVPNVGAEMWGWRPYPVSLEIKDGRIYSMRVSRAIGQ